MSVQHMARPLVVAIASALLAACAVGPNHVRPAIAVPEHFVQAEPAADVAATNAAPAPDSEFWRGFNDPLLTRLVDDALSANHDLRIALANLDRANALLGGAKFDFLPTITAQGQASGNRASASQMPGIARGDRDYNSYNANVQASWELDLFGRVRRSVEAQRAGMQASSSDLQALQVAVVGEVANTMSDCAGCRSACVLRARTPTIRRRH